MTITDPAVAPSADRLAAARLMWSANATRTIVAESRTKEQTKAIRNWEMNVIVEAPVGPVRQARGYGAQREWVMA